MMITKWMVASVLLVRVIEKTTNKVIFTASIVKSDQFLLITCVYFRNRV